MIATLKLLKKALAYDPRHRMATYYQRKKEKR